MTGRTDARRVSAEPAERPRTTDQLDLWRPRRFRAVTPEREAELLHQGRHLTRVEAERIIARLGSS